MGFCTCYCSSVHETRDFTSIGGAISIGYTIYDKFPSFRYAISVAHPREIFKGAVRYSAARVIVAHNHPSGNTEPSEADISFTRRIVDAGEMMGIEVIDHIIIGENKYFSLREHGFM